jgi:hypothetical protein
LTALLIGTRKVDVCPVVPLAYKGVPTNPADGAEQLNEKVAGTLVTVAQEPKSPSVTPLTEPT